MKKGRLKRLGLLPVLASFALPGGLYGRLPEQVPVHWDWQGEIDAYAQRPVGAFLMPAVVLLVYLLLLALPKTSPREFSIGILNAVYERIFLALTSFMFFLSCLITLVGIGMPAGLVRYPMAGLGICLTVLGYYLLRRNSDPPERRGEVGSRTGILAGRLLLGSGILAFAGAAFGNSIFPAMAAVPLALMLSLAYSFVLCWQSANTQAPPDRGPF